MRPQKISDKIISYFIPHHAKKNFFFANIVSKTLISLVEISDIAVTRLVSEERPTFSTIKSQFKKNDLST